MCNNCPPNEVPDPAHGEAVGYTLVVYAVSIGLVWLVWLILS